MPADGSEGPTSSGRVIVALVTSLARLSDVLLPALDRCAACAQLDQDERCEHCLRALGVLNSVRADLATVRALYQMRN